MSKTPFADLTGRRAVVTGSSSGIGRAIALEFAQAGADVVVHYRTSENEARQTADEIQQLGTSAAILSADFSDRESYTRFIDAAWNTFNGFDIWVNNAGADLLTGEPADWPMERKLEELLMVDVRSTIELSKTVGSRMVEAGGGTILNIGWDQADRGMEGDSGELFAASKNAIMGFSRSLAVSLAPNVRVNCIAPGWIRTAWGETASEIWQQRVLDETPLKRWGEPEDIARVARFLASDDAAYITGQVINVNGGAVR